MTAAENGDPGGDTGLGWDAALAGRLHSSIREVFPPVPFKDVAAAIVLDPRFPEPRRIVDMVQGRCWTDLSAAELMLIRSIGLWVTDEAFVALIPAFMDAALADGLRPRRASFAQWQSSTFRPPVRSWMEPLSAAANSSLRRSLSSSVTGCRFRPTHPRARRR